MIHWFTYMMPNCVAQLPVMANESWLTSTDTPVPFTNSNDGPEMLHCPTCMLKKKKAKRKKNCSQFMEYVYVFLYAWTSVYHMWSICSFGLFVCQCTVYWLWDDIVYSADANVHPTPDFWDFGTLQFALYPNSHHLRHWTHKNINIYNNTFLTS